MSFKSIRQLKEFVFRYSDLDGSSRGIREFIRQNVVDFAKNNPETIVSTQIKRAKHPFVRALYGIKIILFACFLSFYAIDKIMTF
jgi:hypothetical protein